MFDFPYESNIIFEMFLWGSRMFCFPEKTESNSVSYLDPRADLRFEHYIEGLWIINSGLMDLGKIREKSSGDSRAVKRRASNLKVRGPNPAVDEIFVRCFSVSPTHTESEKMCMLA